MFLEMPTEQKDKDLLNYDKQTLIYQIILFSFIDCMFLHVYLCIFMYICMLVCIIMHSVQMDI